MITEIAFFAYPVTDMARARRFYEDALGLKVESNFQDQWIEYGVANGTFAITSMDVGHQAGAKGGTIAFEVDDLDAELARLKEKGVGIAKKKHESPVCWSVAITDPDGNEIIIHQRKA